MANEQRTSVLEVLRERLATTSSPGHRSDGFQVALAIEGGGSRSAYSAGMAIAIDELGLTNCFDSVFGTSGGALNAAWLVSGDAQRFLPSWGWPEVAAKKVTDPQRMLRGGPLVDTRVLVHEVYEYVTPMNFAAILASPITCHPVATDARTGEPTDLHPHIRDTLSLQTALRASTCMPLVAGRPVELDGRTFVDGGLSEPVPFHAALSHGATHVLVLRTRRSNQTAEAATLLERIVLAPYFTLFGPGAGRSFAQRHVGYLDDDRRLDGDGAHLLQVRPPVDAPNVSRLSGDLALITRAIEIGRTAMHSVWAS
ncbi:patatin family protein [Smaragdicoccus niigatensis]|uniref:patatin-like phospholipase family protein n=1 Tax=Smaragdicoccus niigatensis TaxID=359359 RepID=UPI000476ACB6|nr:patatin-like phospholipase family protein [Smaragdicoccus niigatensis]